MRTHALPFVKYLYCDYLLKDVKQTKQPNLVAEHTLAHSFKVQHGSGNTLITEQKQLSIVEEQLMKQCNLVGYILESIATHEMKQTVIIYYSKYYKSFFWDFIEIHVILA